MIIVQVTNKVFIVSSLKEIFLDTNNFQISTSLKNRSLLTIIFFIQF